MEKPEKIDYIVYESALARMERTIKRLWILVIIVFAALVITNGAWIWYESQFEDITMTQDVTQDSGEGGTNNFNGNVVNGDYHGETENQTDNKNPQT